MLIATFLSCLGVAAAQMPQITLPWGTYQASLFDSNLQMYTWQNIRFGTDMSKPAMRFTASKYPDKVANNSAVVKESGNSCIQVDYTLTDCIPDGGSLYKPNPQQGEDCLFLDLYVPKAALDNIKNGLTMPVVAWIYGGAFIFGSKSPPKGDPYDTPLYNATGMMTQGQSNMIFVAGNYRLGAYGWLAGNTMESQGYPNAGLSDQRLLLQWIQDYIHLVGGDKTQVTAMGESAGASSILHHLISTNPDGSVMTPNFKRAAIQSPAYEWQWDKGQMESTYQAFAKFANCTNCPVAQLQKVDAKTLATANQDLFQQSTPCTGLFPLGPSIDDKVIRQLSPVALGQNKLAPLESFIVSHVTNEAQGFIPKPLQAHPYNFTVFQAFLNNFIPEAKLKYLINNITQIYAPNHSIFTNYSEVSKQVIQDAVFVCNTRQLFDAYHGKTNYYAMSYDFGNLGALGDKAEHATDVPALFWNPGWNMTGWLEDPHDGNLKPYEAEWFIEGFVPAIPQQQSSYFTSLARFGDPNRAGLTSRIQWPLATPGSSIGNVLQPTSTFDLLRKQKIIASWRIVTDDQNTEARCNFWTNAAYEIMGLPLPKPTVYQQWYDNDDGRQAVLSEGMEELK